MGWLHDFFHGGKDPSEAAKKYLDQIPGTGHDIYDPYRKQGQTADTELWSKFTQMLNDPQGFHDNIMKGYKPSEGYQAKSQELNAQIGNAAASGGIAGTPYHQEQQGKATNALLSQDQNDYYKQIMGIFDQGKEGEQHTSDRGYDASKSLADMLAEALSEQGGLAYKGAENKNAQQSALINSIMQYIQNNIGQSGKLLSGGMGGGTGGGM